MNNKFDEAGMEAIFQTAERLGHLIYSPYQNLWFTAADLRGMQSEGRFRWGPVNWRVRDPAERLEELKSALRWDQKQLDEFEIKMKNLASPVSDGSRI